MRKLFLIILLFPLVAKSQVIADTSIYISNEGDTVKIPIFRNIGTTTTVTTTKLTDSMAVARGLIALKQNALGFTPYNATNPSGYISSITSLNVTTALGFTPYNATNPSGYISAVPAQTFASLTSKPTTLLGYGITDAYPLAGNPSNFLTVVPAQTFASLTGKPTTLSGYGITDGVANTITVNGQALSGNVTVTTVSGNAGTATTLQTPRTINGVSFNGSANITIFPQQVATADIAATASATNTATLFTPAADGMYRVTIYMKITTTGTSPVAGPVTITYTDADGSVAQSHVMLLQNVAGAVVTTTVANSTTTGTVNGSMVMNAKSGTAITYAIAVSGTFAAGRYTAHLTCERIK